MKSKKGFILYFDIQGYRNIVSNKNIEYSLNFKNVLDVFSDVMASRDFSLVFGKDYIKNKSKLLYRGFSDNFFFLYEARDYKECVNSMLFNNWIEIFENMKGLASAIQTQFLEVGVLTRGSITFGEIYYNKQIIYGKDLVKAVNLESNHIEPNILIESDLIFNHSNPIVTPFFSHNNSYNDHIAIIKGLKKYLENLDLTDLNQEQIKRIKIKIEWVIETMNSYYNYPSCSKYFLNDNYNLEKK